MAYSLPGSQFGASKAGGVKGAALAPGKGVPNRNILPKQGIDSAPAKAAPKPIALPKPAASLPPSPAMTAPGVVPVPPPATQPAPSMTGLSAAADTIDGGEAVSGGSGPFRPNLGNRQPPSLAALLQGLRY